MDNSSAQIDHDILFEMTMDSMAVVEVTDSEWTIRAVNRAFETAFECQASAVVGESLASVAGLEIDPELTAGLRAEHLNGVARTLSGKSDGAVFRARHFEADGEARALVVVTEPPDAEGAATPVGLGVGDSSPMDAAARMVDADDIEEACARAGRFLLDSFGFDAFLADIDDGPRWMENLDEPIQVPRSREREDTFLGHDLYDRRNDTRWGLVVQRPIDDHGVVQAGAHTEAPAEAGLVRSIELFGQHFEIVLDQLVREQELRAQRKELAMFNRILRHETLNTLNVVRARLSMIADDVSADNRDHFETIDSRTADLIDRVEAIREMRAEDTPVDAAPRALAPIVRDRVDMASERYPNATFRVEGSLPDIDVRADDLLEFCLRNVLRNTVQHTGSKGPEVRVRVDARRADGRARVHIADDGPGIPDDVDGNVFNRGVSGRESEDGWHGHGLFLTNRIVEDLYGGHITTGKSDLGGAEFVISLPLAEE
jgi:signal transduction histidine kinase